MLFQNVMVLLVLVFLSWSYGHTVLRLFKAKSEEKEVYQYLTEVAVGLAILSFLGVVLNLLHIPLHISIYVLLGILYPAYELLEPFLKRKKKQTKKTSVFASREDLVILALLALILAVFFTVFYQGAHSYAYLEDDDPWDHAVGAKYVAFEKTYTQYHLLKERGYMIGGYLEPYPPTYDVLFGVFHQMHSSLQWILKTINVLFCTLAILFAFLLGKELLGSPRKGLATAFLLAVTPAFMSHFIFSQTQAIAIFIVGLYTVIKVRDDKSWLWPASIVIASMMVTQPIFSASFGLTMILLFVIQAIPDMQKRKISDGTKNIFLSGVFGILLSMLYWVPQLFRFGLKGFLELRGHELQYGSGWLSPYTLLKYSLADLFIAPVQSRMDQATGLGWMFGILFVLALIILLVTLVSYIMKNAKLPHYSKNYWQRFFLLAWAVGMLYVLYSPYLIPLPGPSRCWSVLVIPAAMIVSDVLFTNLKQFKNPALYYGIIGICALLILFSGGVPKYEVQGNQQWPPGVSWTSQGELQGHVEMKSVPGRVILPICGQDKLVIGSDQTTYPWLKEQRQIQDAATNVSGDEIVTFMEQYGYSHLLLSSYCLKRFGFNETQELLSRISETQRFRSIKQYPLEPQQPNSLGFLLLELA